MNGVDKIMKDMNLAVCPLEMYRISLKEAASLKTCEYLARGIPILTGNDDENLSNPGSELFHYKVANDNTLINFNSIISFINFNAKNQKNISISMRNYAIKYVDWKIKLKQYIEFCKEI